MYITMKENKISKQLKSKEQNMKDASLYWSYLQGEIICVGA